MDLIERLRAVPLFQRLHEYDLALVASLCEEHRLEPGTLLCRQADTGTTFILVDEGEALIERVDERGFQRPVRMLRPGEYVGIHSLFLADPRDATITSVQPMRLWVIRRSRFLELVADHGELRRLLLIPAEIEERLRRPRYDWLERGEQVIYDCRRHWATFAAAMLTSTLGLVVLLGLVLLGRSTLARWINPWWLALPLLGLYALVLLWHWIDWRNDYFVVSTWRISSRERVMLFYEARSEAPLDRVQNMNVTFDLLGRYLGYGTLTVETAADIGKMTFDRIPDPEAMRTAIWEQMERARATRQALQQHSIRTSLAAHLGLETGEEPALREELDSLDDPDGDEAATMGRGWWARASDWLAEMNLLPRTHIETAESVTWRKHWVFLVQAAFWPFVFTVALALGAILGFFERPRGWAGILPIYPYALLVGAIVAGGWLWWQANDWGNDLYIVTKDRIIDVEKRPLWLSSQRREASLGVIQNVRLQIPNLWAGLLNYGNVIVQTAARGEFTFERVANPRAVQNEIFRRLEAYRREQRDRELSRQRQDLVEWFSIYDRLKGPLPASPEELDVPESPAEPEVTPEPQAPNPGAVELLRGLLRRNDRS